MSQSQEWVNRLRAVIPWGSSTCSKAPQYMPEEPGVIVRGKGCRVWDADGREFIDYRNALGPVTLGYAFPATDEAIRRQLEDGIIFGHAHPLEAEVAEMICRVVPCAERARFLKTGGEAVAACIRLARYHTGRDYIIHIGYNGWLNSLASGGRVLPGQVAASAPAGVPAAISSLHLSCEWDDRQAIENLFAKAPDQIAAVSVSASYDTMEAGKTFYPFLREITRRYGAVLIYDEIVTGFRVALGGVQEYFNVTPDLAVFAKGVANGMPLSVYCGRAEIMDKLDKAVVSSTYGGETLSLASAKATISTYLTQGVVKHLWQQGEALGKGMRDLFARAGVPLEVKGIPPCQVLVTSPGAPADTRPRFFRAAYRNGVSLYNVMYPNFSHQASDIAETLQRLESAVRDLR